MFSKSGGVRRILPGLIVFVLALVGASPSRAEPPGGTDRKNQLGLYFWIPVLEGTTTLGGTTVAIESSLSDLNVGGPLGYVRTPEPWGALVSTIYLEVESEFAITMPALSGEDAFEFFTMDAVTNRRWGFKNDNVGVELLLGLRYWRVEQRRTIDGGPENEQTESWGDGVLGGRVTVQMGNNWWFLGRFDGAIGQSDESWNAEALFQWRASRLMSLAFGYRLLTVKYETGSGSSRYVVDTDIGGPSVALLFQF